MTNEKRALSWQEFLDSGFDGRDYNFPDFEGTFEAEMVCKRWDKNSKLLVYLDFDDGRKIITSAWQDSNYKGLADIPFNTRVRVTFQYSKKGISYANKDKTENKILTQNVAIGLDGRKHRRNLNVLVCGGSGAGKTRFFAKPNIMNANTSFVVLDPKGELLRDTGHLLKEHGYDIKVLDLINMEKSHCYNPFVYLQSDDDIQRLTTNLFKNTTPKGSQTQDPFWDQTAAMLLKALVCYLHYEAPPDEQNFPMVMEMIRAGDVKENNEDYLSVLDELFERLEAKNPEHIALKYYRAYHSGSAKTLKSIQISLVSRLEKFNLDSLAGITQTDEMDLGEIGERKTAVFAVIPDNDSSFNFIVGMLYTQLFQQLYYQADSVHGGRLPVHVHFVMDEFANETQL